MPISGLPTDPMVAPVVTVKNPAGLANALAWPNSTYVPMITFGDSTKTSPGGNGSTEISTENALLALRYGPASQSQWLSGSTWDNRGQQSAIHGQFIPSPTVGSGNFRLLGTTLTSDGMCEARLYPWATTEELPGLRTIATVLNVAGVSSTDMRMLGTCRAMYLPPASNLTGTRIVQEGAGQMTFDVGMRNHTAALTLLRREAGANVAKTITGMGGVKLARYSSNDISTASGNFGSLSPGSMTLRNAESTWTPTLTGAHGAYNLVTMPAISSSAGDDFVGATWYQNAGGDMASNDGKLWTQWGFCLRNTAADRGMQQTPVAAGGYHAARIIADHGSSQPAVRELTRKGTAYASKVFVSIRFGYNDVFVAGLSATQFRTDLNALVNWIASALPGTQICWIFENHWPRFNNDSLADYATKYPEYQQAVHVMIDVLKNNANVSTGCVVNNWRLLAESGMTSDMEPSVASAPAVYDHATAHAKGILIRNAAIGVNGGSTVAGYGSNDEMEIWQRLAANAGYGPRPHGFDGTYLSGVNLPVRRHLLTEISPNGTLDNDVIHLSQKAQAKLAHMKWAAIFGARGYNDVNGKPIASLVPIGNRIGR